MIAAEGAAKAENPPEWSVIVFHRPKDRESVRDVSLGVAMGRILLNLLVTLIAGGVYFYLALPALNFQSLDFYFFVFLLCVIYLTAALITSGFRASGGLREYGRFLKGQCRIPVFVVLALAAALVVGAVSSVTLFRSGDYQKLLEVKTGDFTKDVSEISFDKLPLLDKDSAQKLGDRKLGELSDMVSQFEVGDDYTQINYQGRPVRVTPLVYGDWIKWLSNRSRGIPAYLRIDMATSAVEVVRLQSGIRYTTAEHFGRNLCRWLRFHYPTYMFDDPVFETDDSGQPYWVCPRLEKTIGLFGGTDINGAVLVNAETGETAYYPKDQVPEWVDRVYTAELILQQYDYYGRYKNGFFNSIFGQKGVTVTTEGYNYIAMNGAVYVYTGVTSVGKDESNIGFILSNQRTKETTYYNIPGAEEYSAMASAEGVVQHLHYTATFPLLLNISGQPTYFMSLKDDAGLVKMYALVNLRQYQLVATGQSVSECRKNYIKLLEDNNVIQQFAPRETGASGKIAEIRSAVKSGNTYYYIRLEGSGIFYAISAADSEIAVVLNPGDTVSVQYDAGGTGTIRAAFSVSLEAKGRETPAASPEPSGSVAAGG